MYPISQGKAPAYDKAATMFSPDGRLYQVEYASKIVSQGTMAVGVKFKNGIILGADKKVSYKLLLPDSIEKLFVVDDHIGAVSAGLVGDARRIIEIARQKSQENRMYYDEEIHLETLSKEVASIMHLFTQYGGMRPFGVAFIFGGIDETGVKLFECEPSGALAEYKAVAIGHNKKEAQKVFEKEFKEGMTVENAIELSINALKTGLGDKEKLVLDNLEFAVIDEKTKKFRRLTKEELKPYLGNKSSK